MKGTKWVWIKTFARNSPHPLQPPTEDRTRYPHKIHKIIKIHTVRKTHCIIRHIVHHKVKQKVMRKVPKVWREKACQIMMMFFFPQLLSYLDWLLREGTYVLLNTLIYYLCLNWSLIPDYWYFKFRSTIFSLNFETDLLTCVPAYLLTYPLTNSLTNVLSHPLNHWRTNSTSAYIRSDGWCRAHQPLDVSRKNPSTKCRYVRTCVCMCVCIGEEECA